MGALISEDRLDKGLPFWEQLDWLPISDSLDTGVDVGE